MASILLAGGSGFIGRRLGAKLQERNHSVSILSRKKGEKGSFYWDPAKGILDPAIFAQFDAVVNLAGASLAKGRWTENYKKRIVASRVEGGHLLYQTLLLNPGRVKTYVSASAIGIYGDTGDAWVNETSPASTDFLGTTCRLWEAEAMRVQDLGIRTVCIRTGLVLDGKKGILPIISRPVRWGLAAPLGTGRQFMSWIHVDDICGIYLLALENSSLQGPYNAVAPAPVRQKEFMQSLAKSLHRPLILPPVPGWMLKLALGEKGGLVLQGQRVSAEKISSAGYSFKYPLLMDALAETTT